MRYGYDVLMLKTIVPIKINDLNQQIIHFLFVSICSFAKNGKMISPFLVERNNKINTRYDFKALYSQFYDHSSWVS